MKKTIKLHWKEATSSYITPKGQKTDTIWLKMTKELGSIKVDSEKVEQLFASKTVELKTKVFHVFVAFKVFLIFS